MREGVARVDPNMLWHFQELFKRMGWLAEKQLKAEQHFLAIESRLGAISQQLSAIEKQLAGLQGQPSTRIDKIEYRFEQLKVDTLSGSLHIGLAHGAEGLIEDLEAGGVTAQNVKLADDTADNPYAGAMSAMQDYLGTGLPQDIHAAADATGVEIDQELRGKITEDLARQAEQRFMLYIKEYPFKEGEDDTAVEAVLNKVRNDVRSGLESFFESYGKEKTV
jgi:spore germination protein PC